VKPMTALRKTPRNRNGMRSLRSTAERHVVQHPGAAPAVVHSEHMRCDLPGVPPELTRSRSGTMTLAEYRAWCST
jgi:hypothetical protein